MVNGFKPPHNSDVFNALRGQASPAYLDRVPVSTQADIQATVQALMDFPGLRNEFSNMLVNRIGMELIRDQSWTNKLGKFKRGMLEYGDTIEEIQTGLIEAYVYNDDREYLEKDIFGTYRPEVQTSFHTVNRRNYYPITINEIQLRRAFTQEYGLSQLINNVIASASTSDQWDEFLIMCQLFAEYEKMDGFFRVNVPDVSARGSNREDANYMLRRVQEFAGTLPFISRHYNASGMPVAANVDELELFITPQANAALDVEALAGAFNIDRAAVPTRVTIIPQEQFNIPGAQAILTTKDFFVVADQVFETRTAENPVALQTNYFMHRHQVISASRFVPAILFTTGPGDTINVIDYDVTGVTELTVTNRNEATVVGVERGEYFQISGGAITDPEGGLNTAIRFSITGEGADLSPRTYVEQTGALFVAHDEPSTSIVVTATSVDDNDFTATVTLPVSGERVVYWPLGDVVGDTEVTPDAPTFDDPTITIPDVEGVQYQIAGEAVTGTADIGDATTVVAVPLPGYRFADGVDTQWEFTPA